MKNVCLPLVLVVAIFGATMKVNVSISQNLPPLEFVFHDSAATTGYYFLLPIKIQQPLTYSHAQMIYDKYGKLVYYRTFLEGSLPSTTADFKLQRNGMISFFSPVLNRFYLMDSTFKVVDSIEAVGYQTDTHELQILENGHYLLLGKETRTMNLTQYKWFGSSNSLPGSPNASVTGAVIQELDENKELVWEWNAHDYFNFADVDSVWLNSPSNVDWTHSNALEMDHDGNILLSTRHFNEITKINYQTKKIMWRMGGKNNQFTFTNDTKGWSGQHDIRRMSYGTVTLWDNGQYTSPAFGRALELSLDESTKIGAIEWEYIYDSTMFSFAMGNHQRIGNNNRLINFGFVEPQFPITVVVKPNKEKVVEIFSPPAYANYRAFNYTELPWELKRPELYCQKTDSCWYLVAEAGYDSYTWNNGTTNPKIAITSPGTYNVFVPYGGGKISSEYITVTDIFDPCSINGLYLIEMPLLKGWNSLSTHLDPVEKNIEGLMSTMDSSLIILLTGDQQYYPAGNINTIGEFDPLKGYAIKLAEDATFKLVGLLQQSKTITLAEGWNYLPVLADCETEITLLFGNHSNQVEIIKEIAGVHLYWPEHSITTLQSLVPNHAYLIKLRDDILLTYPQCD